MPRPKRMTLAAIAEEARAVSRRLQLRRRPKTPPLNESEEAVALRQAAIAFGKGVGEPVADDHDTLGHKRNCALLYAALEYADRVEHRSAPPPRREGGRP